jgi:uncharacterized damage-inducible protein DinB
MASIESVPQASSAKQQFLEAYEREHAITMKVLRAYPAGRAKLQPHPKCKTAKELAWTFVMERGLGKAVLTNQLEQLLKGAPPSAPETFEAVLPVLEEAHREFGQLVAGFSDEELQEQVTFLVAPHTPGAVRRIDFAWFLLHDQIHHRGQFSIYLRMAEGRVPSIYGPTADEPWM